MKHQAHYFIRAFAIGLKRLFTLLFILSLSGFYSSGWAQVPKKTCEDAKLLATVAIPSSGSVTQTGQLANTVDANGDFTSDHDYYKFQGIPGSLVRINLNGATIANLDTSVLAYDSNCYYLIGNYNVDYPIYQNSQIVMTVPNDGIIIVDSQVTDTTVSGAYTLSLTPLDSVGSLGLGLFTGRAIDSITQLPITNSYTNATLSYTNAILYYCNSVGGCQPVSASYGNLNYIILFNEFYYSWESPILPAGTYKIRVYTEQYEPGETPLFSVAKNPIQVDVPLKSYPARLSATACNTIPSQGGKCKFSVTVTNGQTKALDAMVWSVVNGENINILGQYTQFQLQQDYDILLPKVGNTKTLNFEFNVPAGVRDGAWFYVNTYVGGVKRNPNFNIKGEYGFGLEKQAGNPNLTLMPPEKAAKFRHQHRD